MFIIHQVLLEEVSLTQTLVHGEGFDVFVEFLCACVSKLTLVSIRIMFLLLRGYLLRVILVVVVPRLPLAKQRDRCDSFVKRKPVMSNKIAPGREQCF